MPLIPMPDSPERKLAAATGSSVVDAHKLNTFHASLGAQVRERAKAAAQMGREYHESGKLPLPVGARFHTAHSKANGLQPWSVTHHYVDSRDPEHYGYGVKRGTPDVDQETSRIIVSDPAGEARMAKMGGAIDYGALAAQFEPVTGPRVVKASGGKVNGVPIHKNPSTGLLEAMTRRSPEGYMRGLRHNDDHYWWDGSRAIHKEGADAVGIPYDYRDRLEASVSPTSDNFRMGADVHGLPPSLQPPPRGASSWDEHDQNLLQQLRPTKASGGSLEAPGAPTAPEAPKLHAGPIHSAVAGRTDHLPMHVRSGSYVIPADIISAMGEGNTVAGFKHMRRMFGGTPYAQGSQPYGHVGGPYGKGDAPYDGSGGPYGEKLPGKAGGGATGSVPIVAAGGEYVLTPEQVRRAGEGDLDLGHKVLDEFVRRYRAQTIKTLSNLPGPKKD